MDNKWRDRWMKKDDSTRSTGGVLTSLNNYQDCLTPGMQYKGVARERTFIFAEDCHIAQYAAIKNHTPIVTQQIFQFF